MGTTITPEKLTEIQSKKVPKKYIKDININSNILNNKDKNQNLWNIFYNIYFPFFRKYLKNFNEKHKELIDNSNNENIIIQDNAINNPQKKKLNIEEEMNNIIFLKHKSIDLTIHNLYKDLQLDDIINSDITDTNNQNCKYKKEEIYSEKGNESNNSDYADLNKEFFEFNKDKNKKKIIVNENNKKLLISNKIRNSYYNKLIIKNQWNPLKKDRIFNNIFFFDWDDTLLCTSYLIPSGALNNMALNKKDIDNITNLDCAVSQLLLKTLNLGYVFVITNGAPGWVEMSSVKFYPRTAKILERIKIISARGLCEKKLPGDMRQWKAKAFKLALDSLQIKKNVPTNIFCFGDSIIELEASYNIKECFSNAYLKTIKFKENPTYSELENELKIIFLRLDSLLTNFKNISIKLGRKKID